MREPAKFYSFQPAKKSGYTTVVFEKVENQFGDVFPYALEVPQKWSPDAMIDDIERHYDDYVSEAMRLDSAPERLRECAYSLNHVIVWDTSTLTVTEASQLWQYYAAEGSEKANELRELIVAAKTEIRKRYPSGE